MSCRSATSALLWFALAAGSAAAQTPDFWIAPTRYQVMSGGTVEADLELGEGFKGEPQSYSPTGVVRFDLVNGDTAQPVDDKRGAQPALKVATTRDGLTVIVHESTGATQRWADWPAFARYVRENDFTWALQDHQSRGLPTLGFRENVSRFAKALIARRRWRRGGSAAGAGDRNRRACQSLYGRSVGRAAGAGALSGQAAEERAGRDLCPRLADGTVVCDVARTDMEGKLVLKVRPGTEYLIDAVVLRPLPGNVKDDTPVWETLWASLTFRTPG